MGNKFVIIGAGSTHTPGILAALANKSEELNMTELCLHDIEHDRVYHMGEFNKIYMKEHRPEIKTSWTTDLKEALIGANYVFIQIRPGRNEQRSIDEHTCYKHGLIGQETCGLGGFSFALRTIPAILEIVKTAVEVCPDAWLLNYSNPEAMVSEAVYRTYPQAKMLCICDMPISQQEQVAAYLGYDEKDLTFKYFGLNHFGWYTNIYNKKGEDLLPKLREEVLSGKVTGLSADKDEGKLDEYWYKTFNNVIKGFKAYPDFLPLCYLQYYYFHDEMLEMFDHDVTRADTVLAGREITVYEECRRVIEKQTTKDSYLVSGVHGNYIVDLASSIINDKRERFMVNVMNRGAIGNFNHDAVVEVPCYVGASGVEPTSVGYIPQFHKSLMEAQKGYEKLAVEACLEGSYEKALQAILLNKTVPSYRVGKAILDDFLELNKDYWNPKFYEK
ncbi:6-phospho-alpha-glucosidase [Clostridioides sp. ES-S-0108-01]|uniref:family 4 glycosyl hydrolase n=1 Tax=unclassified Clostridioides TaxID=2635829 RepID=UPI001D0CB9D5|nr:6-phospho-alpha-glucosidase [Clostridioides sp. ES-S-0171-01]MCC0686591.1 6-phospho-alpha-glucosidase [Clostridioides sp. ES-S-0056-01]MCC0713889.1 6-phospho-alpha-glucosidase [Clostridioides sp. ES-S-0077-01]MCC0784357.1 6-phospho-alpha-glucosidase [Clostridioides sp. ES-S-0108-01]UDN51685.1 6-phospho-alpha-glucosidase [Clostridioides sp. ES-S-0107-01]UDN55175.1 6-phospho-alpha-glucosidase [Clostridioides sp. ES-S-0054-01]